MGEQEKKTKACDSCKEEIKQDASACPYCGEKQVSKGAVVGCLVIIALIVIGVAIFLFNIIGNGEGVAILQAVDFAEEAIGYDMSYDHDDLVVNEIHEDYYQVNGKISRVHDNKHFRMQSQVEFLEDKDKWRLRYLNIDGDVVHDSR
ncbi:hypothetical protein [Natranaerobius thermophilus]|uniref:Zinc-ribbon domain-containing protein n=1 Tax=Natranaerobius thermophilus (strain ATCC BAA-1301 / DSM 18059 / JW/NM-WN-LF) TaxID=457570 RepID=B2A8P2_NATTJ|nr:hypothetical protein [Natranaerobius thermophilus]ACB86491.1 hypothetical protein Nther_2946 [Natranaerobius thermophilus JW/NM-WN-LF]